MKKRIGLIILLIPAFLFAQQQLTLEDSYILAIENHPIKAQNDWLKEKSDEEISILEFGKLPKLDLNAQAIYQSEVIHFPGDLPNMSIEYPNKDQYRASLDATQMIYNGNNIKAQKKLKEAELQTNHQKVEVNLYDLKYRVNQYYFNVLLLQEQNQLLSLKREQIEERLKEVKASVNYGATLESSEKVLEAELLKLEQDQTQVQADHKKALNQLSMLLHIELQDDLVLETPNLIISNSKENKHPELKLFELQESQLEASKGVVSKEILPALSGFAQVGYGNPGLNMLDNSFQDFYRIGVKLNWNVFDWGQNRKKKRIIEYNKKLISTERENFLLNNNIKENEAYGDINKFQNLLEKDDRIINLREEVLEVSSSQLSNGVIRPSEYITELNDLFEAKIDKKLHEIQLNLAKANYQVIVGN